MTSVFICVLGCTRVIMHAACHAALEFRGLYCCAKWLQIVSVLNVRIGACIHVYSSLCMWVWTILTCPGNPREKNDFQICMYPCLYLCMHAFSYVKLFLVGKCHYVIGSPFPPRHGWRLRRGFRPVSNQFQSGFKVIVPDTQKEQVRNVGKCIGRDSDSQPCHTFFSRLLAMQHRAQHLSQVLPNCAERCAWAFPQFLQSVPLQNRP